MYVNIVHLRLFRVARFCSISKCIVYAYSIEIARFVGCVRYIFLAHPCKCTFRLNNTEHTMETTLKCINFATHRVLGMAARSTCQTVGCFFMDDNSDNQTLDLKYIRHANSLAGYYKLKVKT